MFVKAFRNKYDLRSFFGREPFFDGLIHHDDDDDEGEDGFHHEFLDRFDDVFRFGFSLGPNGMRIQEPQVFGQILQDMEDIFAGLGRFGRGTLHLFSYYIILLHHVFSFVSYMASCMRF